jgi:hypothetical protein
MRKRLFGLLPRAGKMRRFHTSCAGRAESRTATLKAITESRELMAKIDAV